MTKNVHRNGIGSSRKILVLALLAAFGPAQAADESVAVLANPDTAVVAVGVGVASGSPEDRALFGQYNGLRTNDVNLLLDLLYTRRDDAGVWWKAEGRNLGLDILEFGLSGGKQGDWKLSFDYNQLVRRDPHTINTGMQGLGTTTPTIGNSLVAPGAGGDNDLSQKRKGFTFGGSKWIMPNLAFEASYKIEDKDGARLSGIGNYCSGGISPICTGATRTVGALYLTPEPINSTTQQFDAKLTYVGDGFGLTGGYYGAFFDNSDSVMTPTFPFGASTITNTGSTLGVLAANLGQPLALPPDSRANQFYLSGYYAALPFKTRINFKASYTSATQNEGYPDQLLAGAAAGASSLNGTLETTLLQVGLTSRPLPKLSINANARYEDRKNKTDLGNYVVSPSGSLYTNWPNSSEFANAKLEAAYDFTNVGRGMLGVDYVSVNRDRPVSTTWIPDTSMAAMRESTNETGVYAEFRRSMSETLNGALSYRHAERNGYHWYSIDPANGFPFVRYDSLASSTGMFPATMLNRMRDSVKLTGDWAATSALSLNFSLEGGNDRYIRPTDAGVHGTRFQLYNVDAAFALSDNWRMTGYASWGEQTLSMQQAIGYSADLEQVNTAVGLGAVGTLTAAWEVGGDLSYIEDKSHYPLGMTTGADVASLPDSTYRATLLKLYAKVALDKKSDLRFDLIQQWADYNDWTWGSNGVPFAYSDNTTVTMQPTQNVTFFGARYIYRFK
jgi:MtrB/PioB family decaheme-associated outer membrane protein